MLNSNQPLIDSLNHYLSIGSIFGILISIFWLVLYLTIWNKNKVCPSRDFIIKYALPLGFFISLIGSFLTLFYSDYLGVLPCGLCWFQRVYLYSQVWLFGLAWYKKDKKIFDYTLLLSIVGFAFAAYHSYLQMGYSELVPCPVVASTIDCAKPTFVEFGFITFPFMSVVLFAILILLSISVRKFAKHS